MHTSQNPKRNSFYGKMPSLTGTSSIRKKFILHVVVPVTLLYNLIIFAHLYFFHQDSEAEIEAQMHDEVVHFAREIDNIVFSFAERIRAHAELLESMGWPESVIRYVLQQMINSDPLISGVSFSVSENKKIISTVGFIRQGDNILTIDDLPSPPTIIQHNNWSHLLEENNTLWTPAYFEKNQPEKICSYIHSFKKNNQPGFFKLDININRLVSNIINVSSFHGRYSNLHHWKFHLVNSDLNYLYTSSIQAARYGHDSMRETGEVYQISGFGEEIPDLIEKGQTHHYRVWLPSPDYQMTCWVFGAPLPHAQWWLYTAVNENAAMNQALNSIIMDGVLMALSLLIITGGIWYTSSRITSPLVSLKQHMQQYFQEQHPLPMQKEWLYNRDETGSLARSFIQLTHHLAERDKALQTARADHIGRLIKHLKGQYFYFQLDRDGKLAFSNASLNSALGYHQTSPKLEFQRFLATHRDQNRFQEHFKQALAGKWGHPFELNMQHANGDTRRVQIFWGAFHGENNKMLVEGLGHDVTDYVNDTEKFRALLNASPDPSVICNPEGIILMVNAQALKLTRYTRKELINSPLSMLIAVECRSENPLLESLNKCNWQNCRYKNLETFGVDRRGRIFPAELTSSVLDTRDGIFISTVIRDITARKKAEAELLQARDDAMAASRAKSMFLSCMSHELRTPLNGILGYSQVLLQQPDTGEKQRQNLESIKNCGRHLLSLINDILDLSKIENCELTINPIDVNVQAVLKSVEQILQGAADAKSLALSTHISDRVPAEIVIDEIKLKQILLNLGSNAIKYTQEGAVSIEVDYYSGSLHALVRDTGPGIPAKYMSTIFEPFRQLESGRRKGGAGLGLAISKQLVEAQGGQIHLASEEGVGSCFSFKIPTSPHHPDDGEKSGSGQRPTLFPATSPFISEASKQSRILVVDDDATNRNMLTSALEQFHYQTISAKNGEEALTVLNSCNIDLVLMDVRMPVMDGITALGVIRHSDNLSGMRVIAVTASISESTRCNISGYGFDDVILKPVLLDDLMEKVMALLKTSDITKPKHIDSQSISVSSAYNTLQKRLQQALDIGDISSLINFELTSADSDSDVSNYVEKIRHYARVLDMEKLEELARSVHVLVNSGEESDSPPDNMV